MKGHDPVPPGFYSSLDAEFERLLELRGAERTRRIAEIQGRDPRSAEALGRMLESVDDADTSDLLRAADGLRELAAAPPLPPIPGLSFTALLGTGGMATVFAAERSVHGAKEPVAVKMLTATDADPGERERFLEEQRILAELRHPNIATLLDVGFADGRAYMVMERIRGVPIDQAVTLGLAGVERVIEAIERVCDALQFAHEHLIVHRDIKPSNVLIDERGQVKVIDFGIAKRLSLNAAGQATGVLTPQFASPEQLLGRAAGVGSDIYQVGLLAYWLLAGCLPFDSDAGALLPAERICQDAAPPPPSSRVRDSRQRRQVEGDLDCIVLKCLRFDVADRYRTLAELRADIGRMRRREPVLARRRTHVYVARRFARRHAFALVLGAAAVLLVATLAVAGWRDVQRSEAYAARSEQVLATLTGVLSAADPFSDDAGETPVSELLDRAESRFLAKAHADPEFEARVLEQLAGIRFSLRDTGQAVVLLERARTLARDPAVPRPLLLELTASLAHGLIVLGRTSEALELLEGPDSALYDEAAGDANLHARMLHARALRQTGRSGEAILEFDALARRIEAAPERVDAKLRHDAYNSQSVTLSNAGRLDEALAASAKARDALQALPDAHELRVNLAMNTATLHGRAGNFEEADKLFREARAEADARVGKQHAFYAVLARNYSSLMIKQRLYDEAFAILDEVFETGSTMQDPLQRTGFLDGHSRAAMLVGNRARAVDSTLLRLQTLAALDRPTRESVSIPYAEHAALIFFEVGEWELAVEFAQRSASADPAVRDVMRLIRIVAGEMIGRPASDEDEKALGVCERVHLGVLRNALIDHRLVLPAAMPAGCSPLTAARLQAYGVAPDPALPKSIAARTPERSPLVERVLGRGTPFVLTDSQRRDLRAAMDALASE